MSFEKKYRLDEYEQMWSRYRDDTTDTVPCPSALDMLRFNIRNLVVSSKDLERFQEQQGQGREYPPDLRMYVWDKTSTWLFSIEDKKELAAIEAEFPQIYDQAMFELLPKYISWLFQHISRRPYRATEDENKKMSKIGADYAASCVKEASRLLRANPRLYAIDDTIRSMLWAFETWPALSPLLGELWSFLVDWAVLRQPPVTPGRQGNGYFETIKFAGNGDLPLLQATGVTGFPVAKVAEAIRAGIRPARRLLSVLRDRCDMSFEERKQAVEMIYNVYGQQHIPESTKIDHVNWYLDVVKDGLRKTEARYWLDWAIKRRPQGMKNEAQAQGAFWRSIEHHGDELLPWFAAHSLLELELAGISLDNWTPRCLVERVDKTCMVHVQYAKVLDSYPEWSLDPRTLFQTAVANWSFPVLHFLEKRFGTVTEILRGPADKGELEWERLLTLRGLDDKRYLDDTTDACSHWSNPLDAKTFRPDKVQRRRDILVKTVHPMLDWMDKHLPIGEDRARHGPLRITLRQTLVSNLELCDDHLRDVATIVGDWLRRRASTKTAPCWLKQLVANPGWTVRVAC